MRPRPDRILDYREYPVLYVDDERENLRIFELTFRRDFSILTATSGKEGLAMINAQPVAIVLSDHRMPEMLGTEFLARVADLDPKTVRILVTAYGDYKTLESAINTGSIYRFVPKPWTPEEMRMTVQRGIDMYALDRERDQLLRELTLLNRVSKSINQELELQPLIELLLETVTSEFGCDAAAILLLDKRGENLSWLGMKPNKGHVAELLRDLQITEHGAPEFLRRLRNAEAQLLSIADVLEMEGPVKRWITEVSAEETLVVPLVGKKGVIGAFAIDNRRGGRRFSADDRTLIEGLANQAVIALENARLVDDLRRSREEVMRFDRLGTLGTLAAGLAHEINNPLVSIHTFLSMAPSKRESGDREFWESYHALACSEVERIRRLVNTMRQLGRAKGDEKRRDTVDLEVLAKEVAMLLQREASRARVDLHLDLVPGAAKIVGVRDEIHQIFMNLMLNAIHATPEGGEVRVGVHPDDRSSRVCLEVKDTGPGIPEEDLERIFDPFFTTKEPDEGTGLGLTICHRIVSDHGGEIEVHSREGEGTTFRVWLPI